MSFENLSSPETEVISTFVEAVEYLRRLKSAEVATKEPFLSYVKQRESEVKDSRGTLFLALELADIYFEAGFKDKALVEMESSGTGVYSEPNGEIIVKAFEKQLERFKRGGVGEGEISDASRLGCRTD